MWGQIKAIPEWSVRLIIRHLPLPPFPPFPYFLDWLQYQTMADRF
jgi:hypothetical protein